MPHRLGFLAGLIAIGSTLGEPPPEPVEGAGHEERVSVRAGVEESAAAPLGASSTVLDPSEVGGTPSTVTDIVVETAGVSQNGQGGHFQVFSIRGLARQRVLNLISGVRINSERRAGASVSFVDPQLLGSVEVLRGASTTFHGSGAVGGVVQVFPRSQEGWSLAAGYDTRGRENYQLFGYGSKNATFGFSRREAANATAADGTELNTHFTQYSATLKGGWGDGPRRYELLYIPTRGEDIGKANTDFPERTTNYPLERHQLVEFTITSEKGWRAQASLHPHDLETDVVDTDELIRNEVFNESVDFGLGWEMDSLTDEDSKVRWGFQLFGRENVNAAELETDLDPVNPQPPQRFMTLDDAREIEAGAFATFRRERGRTGFEIGGRALWITQRNAGGRSEEREGMSAFAGVTRRVGGHTELRGAVSSGLRFPTLSEQFFTGTTGSGGIIGNPDLDPERSLGLEASAKWTGGGLFVSGTLFHTAIDDYIERVVVVDDLFSFVNLTSGTINGFELIGVFLPTESWSLSFGGQVMRGRDDDNDERLSDIPPNRLYVGPGYDRGGWSFSARLEYRDEITDPNPSEKPVPSAYLLKAGVDRRLTDEWSVSLTGGNLLDETYFASADRKAPLVPERSVGLSLVRRQ